MENITFTSAIRPIKTDMFAKITNAIPDKHFVDYPWTCKESVKAASAYTTGIVDCTMCGIKDGKDVFMMHICPTKPENANFSKIKSFIKNNVNINNPELSVFLLGAKEFPKDKRSIRLFNNLVNFFKEHKIPTSYMSAGSVYEPFDVAYRSSKDEWLVSSCYLDSFINQDAPGIVFKKFFDKIEISNSDYITY